MTVYGQTGSTLGSGSAESATFPTTLDNDQVTVNGVNAPILAVNECGGYPCVTFMVPYETTSPGIADIQLFNQGNASNTISAFVGYTAPGLFTLPQLGAGSANMYYAAAEHADGSIISPSNQAQVSETVAVYLTGLGIMSPAVADGAPGPSNPTASPVNAITVYVGGVQATTTYIGLTPTVVGLSQIDFTIPSGVTSGDNVLEIVGPDSDTYMALISVGTASNAAARPRTLRRAVQRKPVNARLKPMKRPATQ